MRTFQSTAPGGLVILLLSSFSVAAAVVFAQHYAVPRFLGVSSLLAVAVLFIWRISLSYSITMAHLDRVAWAILISHPILSFRRRDPRILIEEGSASTEIFIEVTIWVILFLYSSTRLLTNRSRLSNVLGPSARLSFLLFLLALGSATYSAAPQITLAWSFKLLLVLTLGCLLFDPRKPVESAQGFFHATFMGLVLMLLLYFVLGVASPVEMFGYSKTTGFWRLGGVVMPSTTLSATAGLILILSLIDMFSGRITRFQTWALPVVATVMLLSIGRSGILASAVSGGLAFMAFKRVRFATAIVITLLISVILVPSLLDFAWSYATRGQDEQALSTLTGRLPLWEASIQLIGERPFLGWGYVAGSRVAMAYVVRGWSTVHTHNAALEMLVNLGILGGLLFGGILWFSFSGAVSILRTHSVRHDLGNLGIKCLAVMTFLAVLGIFRPGFAGKPAFEAILFFGTAFCVDQLVVTVRRTRTASPYSET